MTEKQDISIGPETRFQPGRFTMLDIPGHDIGIIRLRDGTLRAIRNQ